MVLWLSSGGDCERRRCQSLCLVEMILVWILKADNIRSYAEEYISDEALIYKSHIM